MTREIICPGCGQRLRLEVGKGELEVVQAGSSDSFEGLPTATFTPVDPDPILGQIAPGAGGACPSGPMIQGSESVEIPRLPTTAPQPPAEPFSVLSLDADRTSGLASSAEIARRRRRGPSWGLILLFNYASAVTLICLWLLWGKGRLRVLEPEAPGPVQDQVPFEARPTGNLINEIQPPEPIPERRMTILGQPIEAGAVEFTPLFVATGRIVLEHQGANGREVRSGGEDVLWLRVRLRNLSSELVFAPLDESFLRARAGMKPDSYLISGHGDRLDLFPLASRSEWTIIGQEFRVLGPGEILETHIASAPDALSLLDDEPAVWRVRLRTGTHRTDVVGVRFSRNEVRSEPPSPN